MKLIDELRAEHQVIDPMVGALRGYVDSRAAGGGEPADAQDFVAFFRIFAGGHHAREEHVLFEALVREVELPRDRGPIANLARDHEEQASLLERIADLLEGPLATEAERDELRDTTRRFSHSLWLHIDAENSVLFPESEERLRRAGVSELETREPSAPEQAVRAEAGRLVSAYPPLVDPGLLRGEECVACPHYGTTCDGVEKEWWNVWEWAEFSDRVG